MTRSMVLRSMAKSATRSMAKSATRSMATRSMAKSATRSTVCGISNAYKESYRDGKTRFRIKVNINGGDIVRDCVVGVIENIITRECVRENYKPDVSVVDVRNRVGVCVITALTDQLNGEYRNANDIASVIQRDFKFKHGLYYDGGFKPVIKTKQNHKELSERPYDCPIKVRHNIEYTRGLHELGSPSLEILVLDSIELGTTRTIIKHCTGINATIWICEYSNMEVIRKARELSKIAPPNIKVRPVLMSVESFIRGFTKRIDAFASDLCGTWSVQNTAIRGFYRNINIHQSKRALLWLTLAVRCRSGMKEEQTVEDFHDTLSEHNLRLNTSYGLTSSLRDDINVLYFEGYLHNGRVERVCGCTCKRSQKMIRLTAFIEPGIIDPIADITTPIIIAHHGGNSKGKGMSNGRGGKR